MLENHRQSIENKADLKKREHDKKLLLSNFIMYPLFNLDFNRYTECDQLVG